MLQVWFQQGTLKVAHLGPLQRFDHSKSYNLDSGNETDEKEEHSNDDQSNASSSTTDSKDEETNADDKNDSTDLDNNIQQLLLIIMKASKDR